MDELEKRVSKLETEVAVLETKMNLIAWLAGTTLVGVFSTLIVVLVH